MRTFELPLGLARVYMDVLNGDRLPGAPRLLLLLLPPLMLLRGRTPLDEKRSDLWGRNMSLSRCLCHVEDQGRQQQQNGNMEVTGMEKLIVM